VHACGCAMLQLPVLRGSLLNAFSQEGAIRPVAFVLPPLETAPASGEQDEQEKQGGQGETAQTTEQSSPTPLPGQSGAGSELGAVSGPYDTASGGTVGTVHGASSDANTGHGAGTGTETDTVTDTVTGDHTAPRLLIVEDNESNRTLLELYLKTIPHHASFADNGEQGLLLLKNGEFDLVLMDVEMPKMDGLTATRLIRQFENETGRRRTPVAAITAHALPEHKADSINAGCDYHITKPLKKKELLALIEDALKKPPAAADA